MIDPMEDRLQTALIVLSMVELNRQQLAAALGCGTTTITHMIREAQKRGLVETVDEGLPTRRYVLTQEDEWGEEPLVNRVVTEWAPIQRVPANSVFAWCQLEEAA